MNNKEISLLELGNILNTSVRETAILDIMEMGMRSKIWPSGQPDENFSWTESWIEVIILAGEAIQSPGPSQEKVDLPSNRERWELAGSGV